MLLLAFAATAEAFSLALTGGAARRSAAAAAEPLAIARATPFMAYNPQPTKGAFGKKKKNKAPKEKVKAPAPTAGVALTPEQTFWEGPPSMTETLIPGLSLFTVVGIIPFSASIARQAWTKYKMTNRRIEVATGFQGKDVVQVLWREIEDVKWLRRYGGAAGDLVFSLMDGSKLEVRSVPDFDRNLAFLMTQLPDDAREASGFPDGPARDYLGKVQTGELPKPDLESLQEEAAAAQ